MARLRYSLAEAEAEASRDGHLIAVAAKSSAIAWLARWANLTGSRRALATAIPGEESVVPSTA